MAKLGRLRNLLRYGHPRRFRAALGLLTSTSREPWLDTIGVDFNRATPEQVLPWITFPSIDYLLERISPDMKVLEYGAGFSTIWWAGRVAKVTSLERHADWAGKVQAKLDSLGHTNVNLRVFGKLPEADSRIPWERFSRTELDRLAEEYIRAPEPEPEFYDVVVVDDIFRPETLAAGAAFLKKGGLLILDDSEREVTRDAMKKLTREGWYMANFWGPAPYHFHEKQTTIFTRPKA